jgi:hypothetical protein
MGITSRPGARRAAMALAVAAATLAIVALTPVTARADAFTDIADSVNKWLINTLFGPIINGMFSGALSVVGTINSTTLLTTSFSSLFGHGTALYELADGVRNSVVKPCAHSILALVMLVQLVRVSEKVDGSATMPAVKEVVELAVFFVIFSWLINNSGEICEAIFDDLTKFNSYIGGGEALSGVALNSVGDNAITDFAAIGPLVITALLVFLFAIVAQVFSQLMVYARAIQLYVYFMLSPIPFALMGFEETRHMGINFVKNFVALCLAGTIMMFVLTCFPMLVNMVAADMTQAASPSDVGNFILWPLKLIAMCLLLILSLMRSGSWAKDILGG